MNDWGIYKITLCVVYVCAVAVVFLDLFVWRAS